MQVPIRLTNIWLQPKHCQIQTLLSGHQQLQGYGTLLTYFHLSLGPGYKWHFQVINLKRTLRRELKAPFVNLIIYSIMLYS